MAEEGREAAEMGAPFFILPGAGVIMSKVDSALETGATEGGRLAAHCSFPVLLSNIIFNDRRSFMASLPEFKQY